MKKKSLFYKRAISIHMIKIDVELIRFGVLVDGVEQHVLTPLNG